MQSRLKSGIQILPRPVYDEEALLVVSPTSLRLSKSLRVAFDGRDSISESSPIEMIKSHIPQSFNPTSAAKLG